MVTNHPNIDIISSFNFAYTICDTSIRNADNAIINHIICHLRCHYVFQPLTAKFRNGDEFKIMTHYLITISIISIIVLTIIISGIIMLFKAYHTYKYKPDLRKYMSMTNFVIQWVQYWITIIPLLVILFAIYGVIMYFNH